MSRTSRAVIILVIGVTGLLVSFLPQGIAADEVVDQAGGAEHPIQSPWQYGAYVDASYALNFNFPENHRWRSRTSTPRTNDLAPNMGLLSLRKIAAPSSRWGLHIGVQGGYDTKEFAFGQDRPLLAGADTLRHVGYANVSYLAPIGKGLRITAGLFDSVIGYESLYAIRNPNYSRSWIADNSPYKMFGLYAEYAPSETVELALGVINGYWHLANPNSLPSYLLRAAWHPTDRITLIENVYYGPDQRETDLAFWRAFSNFIAQWQRHGLTVAFSYDLGTERVAVLPGHPRTYWTGAALFTRWQIAGPWSVGVRPEVYWDQDGRQTGFEQFVKAVSTTVDYQVPVQPQMLVRLEHRYDHSSGAQGGFFRGGDLSPGVPALARDQHLLFLSVLWLYGSF